ncbi:sperm flagellar protein 2-like [Lycorma delicatula]|uniref:sperm flagellar protein 2-like n=1 Tax=Lycorma delicatula TaxID=130591 RepID=UPI003F51854F
MIDILINWLKTCMGIILDVEKLGNELKDGTVFIKIFEHYLVIKPKLVKNILPTDDEVICRYNLVQQKIWFKLLDIDFNDHIIDKIIKCDFSTCIHVLYQMFEILENKNSVNFFTKQKERFLKNSDKKFNITEVSILDIQAKTNKSADTIKYSGRILKNKSLINWYENKYGCEKRNDVYHKGVSKSLNSYTRTCGSRIDKINESVNKNKSVGVLLQPEKKLMVEEDILYVRNELRKFSSSSDGITCDKDENIDFAGHRGNNKLPSFSNSRTHSRSKFMNNYQCHTDIYYRCPFLPPISAKPNVKSVMINQTDYMNKLKCNIAMSFKIREETNKFSNLVINEVWRMFLNNEEEDIKRIISFRLIKQPFFEREMCTKFFQIINQNEIQKQSYIELEKCVAGNSVLTSNDTKSNEDANCLFDDYVVYYLSEKKRTVQLHKRLYAEKLKFQFDKQYAVCLKTIADICDLAVKKSEFESKYGLPLPPKMWSEWRCLFYNEQPIFGLDDNIEKLAILFSREESNSDISVEVRRQNVLHESDLDDYLYLQQEWADLLHHDESSSIHTYCDLFDNQLVLGYIIRRLLDIKYPLVPQPKPADIPKYPIRAVVNGLESEELIMELKNLLIKSDIIVIDVNSVVYFCMQSYKDAIKLRNEEFSEYILSSDLLKYKETSCKSLQHTSEEILSEVSEDNIHTKYTQTEEDDLLEEDDLATVSKGVKLGAEILNILLSGNELPSSILVDAIIEYIKNNENNIKGWVIVNFPSTLLQASVIEYVLSSKKFPFNLYEGTNSVYSELTAMSQRDNDAPTNNEFEERSHNIVPNPRKFDYDDTFKTYFSLYLTIMKGETTAFSSLEEYTSLESEDLDGESTTLLEHPEKEGVPTIHTFYQEQDISYDFIYETFDLNTLKQLAHLILSHNLEDAAKQRTSSEFLGENIVGMFSGSSGAEVHDSAYKHESPVKIIKNKAGILGFTSHEVTDNEPSLSIHRSESSFKDSKSSSPGDKDWVFADYPISDNILVSLASFWEGLVNNYISNLKDIFFTKRNNDYMLIPYITHITQVMKECFNREDVRQSVVTEFLTKYNDIHHILRSDLEIKCELHLCVEELKTQLTALCEKKMNDAEKMRQTIVNQNWLCVEFIVIANCFISLLQTEMDRCIYTLELIRDYYMSMLENYESKPLNNVMLNRIKLNYEEIQQTDFWSVIIKRILSNDKLESVNPAYELIEKEANTVCSEVENFQSLFEGIIVKEKANAMKNHKKYVAQKKDEKKGTEKLLKESVDKMKSADNNKNGSKSTINEIEQENFEEMGKRLENLFLEWNCAVKNETDRILMRVKLIMLKACQDLTNIETVMKDTFDNFYKTLTIKFNEECKCIDQLCEIFHLAIEENTQIHADFYFNQDKLYVERRYFMKPASVLKLPSALEEMLLEESFTIKQLEAIKERLLHVAPNGVISQSAFVTIIQNMILPGSENGGFKLMPKIWNQLQPNDCVELFKRIFGNVGLIEWKDFLIHCLDLPFPVMEDIVDAKLQFLRYDSFESDIVTYDDYMNVTLWFQRELPESPLHVLHIILAKEFLFSLYKVNENSVNYMALLLGFCRDEDVKVGFGKGLSLLYGRCVAIYEEDLSLEQILTDHINTEFKIVDRIIDDLLYEVVAVASGTDENNVYDDDDNDNGDNYDLRNVYSVDFADNGDPTLEEYMYDQFFRRHVVLQWCSSVPYTLIITLLSISFCPVFFPNIAHETCFVAFKELRSYVSAIDCIEDSVFVPSFMQNWWLELVLKYIHKFTVFEVTKIVEDIVKKIK